MVDDQEGSRYTLVRMLQKAQYQVKEAGTGRDTLRLATEQPDLIILDIGLPDLSGYEVCQKIKADPSTAAIPVLHLSASFAESENRVRGLEGGADGYLTYPVEPMELLANVRALLRVREAERQIRQQRELLRVTLSSIGDGVIATDVEGRITFINPVAQSLTGWSQEDATERSLDEVFRIVHSESDRPVDNPVRRVLNEGITVGLADSTVLIARDETRKHIDDTAAPIRDDQGNLVGAVLIFRDVSQRRRAEQPMRENEQRLRLAMEASALGMWNWDLRTDGITWSPECYAIFGVRPEEFNGTREGVDALIHPEDRARVWERCARPCSSGRRTSRSSASSGRQARSAG